MRSWLDPSLESSETHRVISMVSKSLVPEQKERLGPEGVWWVNEWWSPSISWYSIEPQQMGRAPWEKWIMHIRLLLHFSQSRFHHFTCCLSWADLLCISSHVGSPGSEIIFNWFSLPNVNLLKIFVPILSLIRQSLYIELFWRGGWWGLWY